MSDGPALSVVLPTDAFDTIAPVVERLRAQSAAARIELVLVTPKPDELRAQTAGLNGLGGLVVVEIDRLEPLNGARAAGIRAAAACVVFVGETHTYAHEDWAGELIDAHAGGQCAAVVPGFGNGNPTGTLSWAGFLTDYGSWLSLLEPRELTMVPAFNTAYRREALLELGPALDGLMSTGDELMLQLRAAGRRFTFHPSARIDHVNVARTRDWLVERYLGGLLTAHSRMESWTRRRRLLYAAGSPLIPVVVLARVRKGVSAARKGYDVPLSVYPALVLGAVISAAGEFVRYLGGTVGWAERRMTEYEINRLRYVRS